MDEKLLREWKKVYESDLEHLSLEFRDVIEEPAVVIVEGEMGAGKTTFTRHLLEDEQEGMSPTYSLVYESGDLVHADFYRIEKEEEIIHLELSEYLEGKKLVMIEWGKKFLNRIEKEIPDHFHFYTLLIESIDDDNYRKPRRNYKLFELEVF